jgi:hypothetical protein
MIEILIDRNKLEGTINVLGVDLESRQPHPDLAADPLLPDATRLWAALQQASGGSWGGCVYDVDRIIELLEAGWRALEPAPEGRINSPLRPPASSGQTP